MARSFSFDHYRIGKRDVRPDRRAEARGNLTRSQASERSDSAASEALGGEISGAVRLAAPAAKRATEPRPKGSSRSQAEAVARSLKGPPGGPGVKGAKGGGARSKGRRAVPIGALPPVEDGAAHGALLRELEDEESPGAAMLEEAKQHASDLQRSLAEAAGALKRLLQVPVARRRRRSRGGA